MAPDAILAEICWWSRNVFEAQQEGEEETSQTEQQPMEIDLMHASDESDYDDSEYDGNAYGYEAPTQPQQPKEPARMQGRVRASNFQQAPSQLQQQPAKGKGRGRGQIKPF